MRVLLEKVKCRLDTRAARQFAKFFFVGALNTLIYYAVYLAMLLLGFGYVLAAAIGTVCGVINSFVWNKRFTFRSNAKGPGVWARFLTVIAAQYVCNVLVIHLLVSHIQIQPEVAGLFGAFVGMFVSFFGHKFWSFRHN